MGTLWIMTFENELKLIYKRSYKKPRNIKWRRSDIEVNYKLDFIVPNETWRFLHSMAWPSLLNQCYNFKGQFSYLNPAKILIIYAPELKRRVPRNYESSFGGVEIATGTTRVHKWRTGEHQGIYKSKRSIHPRKMSHRFCEIITLSLSMNAVSNPSFVAMLIDMTLFL